MRDRGNEAVAWGSQAVNRYHRLHAIIQLRGHDLNLQEVRKERASSQMLPKPGLVVANPSASR